MHSHVDINHCLRHYLLVAVHISLSAYQIYVNLIYDTNKSSSLLNLLLRTAQLPRRHIPNPTPATQAILKLHDTAATALSQILPVLV